MVKRYKLAAELSFDYSIIGIASQLKDYRLCFFINQALGIKLERKGELPVSKSSDEDLEYYPFFRFFHEAHRLNWFLVPNKNHRQQIMISGLRQLNFFLISDGKPPFMSFDGHIQSLRNIANVQMAQEIVLSKSKSIIPFLQDLELYILELDRKK